MTIYSEKVIEHFMCPQNAHSMPDADAEGSCGDPSCGDYLTFYLRVKGNRIEDISYLVFGCCASIASSSMTSVLAKGKTIIERRIRMKIAIPTDEKNLKSNVCVSFGRTPYFLIYDTETKESVFIDNNAAASTGGAGIKAAQMIVDNRVNALLAPRCGENAADVLRAADIKIFKTMSGSVKDTIDAFIDGKLSLLDEIHAGFHGHGSN